MTLHVGPLPAGDERHLKALEGAGKSVFLPEWAAEVVVAAYHRSLAEQGVRLVDASEVAEWLHMNFALDEEFLARFGGGDER